MPKWDVLGGAGRVLTYVGAGLSFVLLFTGLSLFARVLGRPRDVR